MDNYVPSVGFDQGEEPDVPYVRIGLLALLGVMATIILMSMIWKPDYYAELMGAKKYSDVASKEGLSFVSAEVDDDKSASRSASQNRQKRAVRYLEFKVPKTSPSTSPTQNPQ